ncbi:MAG TPA: hypothetical protein VGE21_04995 [Flavobacteriales bacterium]
MMRLDLDDNERGAFHYLFAGVVLVLLLKGINFALDLSTRPDIRGLEALEPFRQGYLLNEPDVVVSTSAGRFARIASALVWSVGAALAAGTIAALLARLLRSSARTAGLRAARIALVLCFGWGLYSALFIPVERTHTSTNGLERHRYRWHLADIPMPFTRETETLPGDQVQRIEAVAAPALNGCESTLRLQAVRADGNVLVLGEVDGTCPLALERLRQASDAAALLERAL